jgi:hypothetical protein
MLTPVNIIEYIVSFLNAVYFIIGILVVSYHSKTFSPDSYSKNCSNVMLMSWLSIGNCFINMYNPIMIINIIGFIGCCILLGFNGENIYLLHHDKKYINCREYYEYNYEVLWNVYIGFALLQMFTLIAYALKFLIELENRKKKNYTIIKS